MLFEYLVNASIPIIWTLHDCWPMTDHCTYFDAVECCKWEKECYDCPQKRQYPASYFVDNSKKNYQLKKKLFTSVNNLTLVSVSHWLDSVVSKSFLGTYQRTVIYNGIDVDLFYSRVNSKAIKVKYGLENFHVLIGVANVWNNRKGLEDYLLLSRVIPESFRIVLVGLSCDQIKKFPSNILGIRRTENIDELAELYSAADISLNLSYEEILWMTTLEAMACGKPCIVYDCTANPELVTKDKGIVVQKGDIPQIMEAIITIISKKELYNSDVCRQRILTFFRKEDHYAEYIHLYEHLLSMKVD